MIRFILNEKEILTEAPPGLALLDFIRKDEGLYGTKTGCREGDCGACTILVGELKDGELKYHSATSCLMPLGNAHLKHIVSVEGLNMTGLSPVQETIIDEGATQCGFCTVGFVLSLSEFMLRHQKGTLQEAIAAMDGNICRCTGYKSLERAAEKLVDILEKKDLQNPIDWLSQKGYLPTYFKNIHSRLKQLQVEAKTDPSNIASQIIGGGTDLMVQRPEEIREMDLLLIANDLSLKKIKVLVDECHIGIAASVTDLLEAPEIKEIFPYLGPHLKLVSSTPIRNMGTLGGNFVNASPIGDMSIFFLALNSQLKLRKGDQSRTLPLKDFFKGYKDIDLKEGEIIEGLFFKIPDLAGKQFFNFEKVSKRTHLDIASVNSACLMKIEKDIIQEASISAGGVSPIPLFLKKSSNFLAGKKIGMDTFRHLNAIAQEEISPISDVRGSEKYKRLLLRQQLFAHFEAVSPELMKIKELFKL